MFTLPPLPYAENALDPVISANTLSFHYGKHHKAYVDNLNNLAKGTEYESAPLEKVIRDTAGKADKVGLFNNGPHMLWHNVLFPPPMRGAPARAIQELEGHQDLTTPQLYMHLRPAAPDSAIRLLYGSSVPAVLETRRRRDRTNSFR